MVYCAVNNETISCTYIPTYYTNKLLINLLRAVARTNSHSSPSNSALTVRDVINDIPCSLLNHYKTVK